ncbi:hypothetical protein BGP77_01950 [Saccharospirillum sp. MSK14-1]|uniref:hypothetical protein n=1 Tax=Saccharospirillum sp. MSK14-1 TaxID=1897632 RepID=UPI000D3BED7E|nr:hypothetical protein [Saccharospirillum sp. MSK14-1]PTY36104.1 hypothetical protein BGP77_01950 [Saccharospirillum sp. MSK14-1]
MSDDLNQHQLQLIAGHFDAEEAREVLIKLIDSKIGFHERKEFSHQERFGETAPGQLTRIEQLQQTRQDVMQLLDTAAESGQILSINCTIDIALQSKPSA